MTTKADILARFGAPTTIQRRDIEGLLAGVAARYQGENLTIKLDPALLEDVYIYEYRRVNRTIIFRGFFNGPRASTSPTASSSSLTATGRSRATA